MKLKFSSSFRLSRLIQSGLKSESLSFPSFRGFLKVKYTSGLGTRRKSWKQFKLRKIHTKNLNLRIKEVQDKLSNLLIKKKKLILPKILKMMWVKRKKLRLSEMSLAVIAAKSGDKINLFHHKKQLILKIKRDFYLLKNLKSWMSNLRKLKMRTIFVRCSD